MREVEFMQPWSDVLMRTKLPDEVLGALIEITDQVLQNPDRENWGKFLLGQIEEEPLIPHQMMMDYKLDNDGSVFNWLMNCIEDYVKFCTKQQAPSAEHDEIKNVEWLTKMKSCWAVSQWEGEYNPIHIHTNCDLSSVLYLKVPEFLPSIKPEHGHDGSIMFIGGAAPTTPLTRNEIQWKPNVGDFFIFPAHLQHCVYPFKTEGAQERRSVSFNADFISRQQLETEDLNT
jgi:uncharacterized protein (TIGR02466 family)